MNSGVFVSAQSLLQNSISKDELMPAETIDLNAVVCTCSRLHTRLRVPFFFLDLNSVHLSAADAGHHCSLELEGVTLRLEHRTFLPFSSTEA